MADTEVAVKRLEGLRKAQIDGQVPLDGQALVATWPRRERRKVPTRRPGFRVDIDVDAVAAPTRSLWVRWRRLARGRGLAVRLGQSGEAPLIKGRVLGVSRTSLCDAGSAGGNTLLGLVRSPPCRGLPVARIPGPARGAPMLRSSFRLARDSVSGGASPSRGGGWRASLYLFMMNLGLGPVAPV